VEKTGEKEDEEEERLDLGEGRRPSPWRRHVKA